MGRPIKYPKKCGPEETHRLLTDIFAGRTSPRLLKTHVLDKREATRFLAKRLKDMHGVAQIAGSTNLQRIIERAYYVAYVSSRPDLERAANEAVAREILAVMEGDGSVRRQAAGHTVKKLAGSIE